MVLLFSVVILVRFGTVVVLVRGGGVCARHIYIILTKTMYSPLLGRGLVGLFGLCGVDEFS